MKVRDFEKIVRELEASLPGFQAKGQLLFANPVGDILRGFFFDGSDYSRTDFTVMGFFQPLFPAMTHVHFTFGKRIRDNLGRDSWDTAQPDFMVSLCRAIMAEAPRVGAINDAKAAAAALALVKSANHYWSEALAACLARSKNLGAAQVEWHQLTSRIAPTFAWQTDMLARIETVSSAFSASDQEGQALLDSWAGTTRNALGLPT